MTITLPAKLEAMLKDEAGRRGLTTDAYVAELLSRAILPSKSADTVAELFEQLRQEQGTDDPAEIKKRQREEEEFMEAMNRNRREMEGPQARTLYP